jgi:hypothetical protein
MGDLEVWESSRTQFAGGDSARPVLPTDIVRVFTETEATEMLWDAWSSVVAVNSEQ